MPVTLRITNATTGEPVETWQPHDAIASFPTRHAAVARAAMVVGDLGLDHLVEVVSRWSDDIAERLDVTHDNVRVVIEVASVNAVTVRLELTPMEAATLHYVIGTHMPVYHGVTRDSLIDIRRRLLASLKDAGVLA